VAPNTRAAALTGVVPPRFAPHPADSGQRRADLRLDGGRLRNQPLSMVEIAFVYGGGGALDSTRSSYEWVWEAAGKRLVMESGAGQ